MNEQVSLMIGNQNKSIYLIVPISDKHCTTALLKSSSVKLKEIRNFPNQSLLDCEGKNARVSVENYDGVMPLTMAAGGGHALILKKLLKSRDMRLMGDHAEKAVVAAVERDKFDCAKMILGEFQASNVGSRNHELSLIPHQFDFGNLKKYSVVHMAKNKLLLKLRFELCFMIRSLYCSGTFYLMSLYCKSHYATRKFQF